MNEKLQDIFRLEDNKEFDIVFEAYKEIYSKSNSNYEIWKYFYFFLWTASEDAPDSFQNRIDLEELLNIMFEEGKLNFKDVADFNFIAGYTVSIFPYVYGDYSALLKEANQMLLKASQLEPTNKIYKMVYLGSFESADKQNYEQARIDAAPKVLEIFSGNGSLNKYFRDVLYGAYKKA